MCRSITPRSDPIEHVSGKHVYHRNVKRFERLDGAGISNMTIRIALVCDSSSSFGNLQAKTPFEIEIALSLSLLDLNLLLAFNSDTHFFFKRTVTVTSDVTFIEAEALQYPVLVTDRVCDPGVTACRKNLPELSVIPI
jgi:hypothetical protein